MLNAIPYNLVSSIVKQYDTNGHSPYLTFCVDFKQYVLKTCNNRQDKPSLSKEFLCSMLLKYWDIDTPNVAALSLNPELLVTTFVQNDSRFSISNLYFGSELKPNAVDLQLFISAKGKVALRKIINAHKLLEIALFDIWIENDDRRPSNNNLLLCPENKGFILMPIDHAHTFGSLDFGQLNPEYVSFSDNDSILHSPIGHAITRDIDINEDWLENTRKKFYLRTSDIERSFQQICGNLPTEFQLTYTEKNNLAFFLFNQERNKKVFEQFSFIINSII